MVFRWSRYPASIATDALFPALRYLSLSIVSPVFLATLARWSRLRINFWTGVLNQAGRLLRSDVNLDGMHSSMAAEIACVKWFQFASTELASGEELKKVQRKSLRVKKLRMVVFSGCQSPRSSRNLPGKKRPSVFIGTFPRSAGDELNV